MLLDKRVFNVLKDCLRLFDPHVEDTVMLQNVMNYTPNNAVSPPRRSEYCYTSFGHLARHRNVRNPYSYCLYSVSSPVPHLALVEAVLTWELICLNYDGQQKEPAG